jgi:hypothetical protein
MEASTVVGRASVVVSQIAVVGLCGARGAAAVHGRSGDFGCRRLAALVAERSGRWSARPPGTRRPEPRGSRRILARPGFGVCAVATGVSAKLGSRSFSSPPNAPQAGDRSHLRGPAYELSRVSSTCRMGYVKVQQRGAKWIPSSAETPGFPQIPSRRAGSRPHCSSPLLFRRSEQTWLSSRKRGRCAVQLVNRRPHLPHDHRHREPWQFPAGGWRKNAEVRDGPRVEVPPAPEVGRTLRPDLPARQRGEAAAAKPPHPPVNRQSAWRPASANHRGLADDAHALPAQQPLAPPAR